MGIAVMEAWATEARGVTALQFKVSLDLQHHHEMPKKCH